MILAIVQARLGSTRFPRKVFSMLADKYLLWHVIHRLGYSRKIEKTVLATTDSILDNELVNWAIQQNIAVYRGNEENVLERFYYAAKQYSADIIVRVTADDPFKDPVITDHVIDKLIKEELDFAYNNHPPTFPEGLDVEVFTMAALEKAYLQARDDFEKEHVTQYFYRNKIIFKQGNYRNNINLSSLRWTIDTMPDYNMAKHVYDILYKENEIFLMNDILEVLRQNPFIAQINASMERSTMYKI